MNIAPELIHAVRLVDSGRFFCGSCRHDWVESFKFKIVTPKEGDKCDQCHRTWSVIPTEHIARAGYMWQHANNIDRLAASINKGGRYGGQLHALRSRDRETDSR